MRLEDTTDGDAEFVNCNLRKCNFLILTFRNMISETQMEALPKSRHEAQLVDRLQESLVAAESQSKKNCQSNFFVLSGSKSGSADPKGNAADSSPDDR
jgi:hypothetical protein